MSRDTRPHTNCKICGRLFTEHLIYVGCSRREGFCICERLEELDEKLQQSLKDKIMDRYGQAEANLTAKTNNSFIADIKDTFDSAYGILLAKNHDYASLEDPFANFKNCLSIGISVEKAIYVRFLDKVARMSNFLTKEKFVVKDETFEDTLIDAINYLAILKAWHERQKLTQAKINPLND